MEHGRLMPKPRDPMVTWLRITDMSFRYILYFWGGRGRSCKITMLRLVYS